MLTPRFELSQTEDNLKIIIHAPYANIKDTVVHVDGTDFRFYSTPYYLSRLNLPGEIEENDASTGDYICEKGDFTMTFSKVCKGEHFENLDMITTLLAPIKKKTNFVPTIEVISNPCIFDDDLSENEFNTENIDNDDSETANEWSTPQNPITLASEVSLDSPKYGFGNKISGALNAFEDSWIREIIDLPLPDKTLPENRQKLREKHELESFNEEYYMADLMEPECVESYLSYKCDLEKGTEGEVKFDDTEKDILKELPNKEYLLNENEIKTVLYSMIDILFASCYNYRITLGENNVESGWTISKLSATLSWFQNFTNLHDVILSSIRRSLCYPQVRNWNLSMKIFQDVRDIVKLGKKYIIKRFCEIHSIFNNSYEPRYVLNQLYIKDYLIWLQQLPDSKIKEVDLWLENIDIKKEELGLDLVELEEAAYSVQEENLVIENEIKIVYNLPDDLQKLVISSNANKQQTGHPKLITYSDSDSESDSLSFSSSSSSSSSSDSTWAVSENDNDEITDMSNKTSNDILDSDDDPN
ncbi:protein SHQ1 homolog [Phymastichus coffea]|uniref:protein SHQ1 homolog n=1 Tax=Phymastichus coffea TaxID=108790 RepID=UPI00273BFEFB|nr:protein SHQ1 homolog [Phymastichus coffea]